MKRNKIQYNSEIQWRLNVNKDVKKRKQNYSNKEKVEKGKIET